MLEEREVRAALVRIGRAIRQHRQRRGMKLKEVSRRSGVTLGYVSQVELGRNSASIGTLMRICHAFGITLPQLFLGVDWSPSEPVPESINQGG